MPWTPHRTRQPPVGLRIVLKLFGHRVPLQLATEAQGDVLLLHYRLGAHGAFDRADRLLPATDGVQQVTPMVVAADYLNLVRTDFLRGKQFGMGHDPVAAHENPTL